jgi:hypothetical protein
MDKELKQFAVQRKMLFWSVKDPSVLSVESITETVLNYGDWQDF